jgi:GT2 family glycosyltransferase
MDSISLSNPRQETWPSVTVVIVNWNGERFLDRCLSALLAQTVLPREIILLDNASSDASLDIIQRYASVRLLTQSENLGFARGNNLAIVAVAAESEWIALLNTDAFVEPDWLQQLITAAKDNSSYSMFASRLLMEGNRNLLDGDGDVYHVSGMVWREGQGNHKYKAGQEPREVFSPCAAAAMYRADAFKSVCGFDEDFFCYIEDVDLGYRLRLKGHRCLLVPSAVVYHIGSASAGGQQSDFAIYYGHRNLVWAYVKNMPGWLFWACMPLHIAMNLVVIFVFIWRGKGRVILQAKHDALFGLSKMWRKRREIQRQRVASVGEIWRVLNKHISFARPDR